MSELHDSHHLHQQPASELLRQPEQLDGHTVFEGIGFIDKPHEQTQPQAIQPEIATTETKDPLVNHWREAYGAFSREQKLRILTRKKQERREEQQRRLRLMGLSSMIGGPLIRDQQPDHHKHYDHDR